jgi:Zn-finger nucleic acid-binding protein
MALSVPLSRCTSRVGGGSAFYVRPHYAPVMFCPKCSAELVRRGSELTCVAGEMGLSQNVERILTERYSKHTASARRGEPTTEQYPWFCPGCGVLLGRDMLCPECHVSLRDLQHQLVEFHPHKNGDGRWT